MIIRKGHCHKTFEVNQDGKVDWLNVSFDFDVEDGEDPKEAAIKAVKIVEAVYKKTHPKQRIKKPTIRVNKNIRSLVLNEMP